MRVEHRPLSGPILVLGELLTELFALCLELGPCWVEDFGESCRTPRAPTGQFLAFLGSGFPVLGLDPTQSLDRGDVGLEPCLGARRCQIIR